MLPCHSLIYVSQASFWEKLEPPETEDEREQKKEVREEEKEHEENFMRD